jgi:hypothetical protein
MSNTGIFYLNGEPVYWWLVVVADAVPRKVDGCSSLQRAAVLLSSEAFGGKMVDRCAFALKHRSACPLCSRRRR